jgi:hypothetical protein
MRDEREFFPSFPDRAYSKNVMGWIDPAALGSGTSAGAEEKAILAVNHRNCSQHDDNVRSGRESRQEPGDQTHAAEKFADGDEVADWSETFHRRR